MSTDQARDALVAAGYKFIQTEPRLPGARDWRPDIVAWASDTDGMLVPWAVIELKSSLAAPHLGAGLSSLARARDILGTVEHYVVFNDREWHRADPGIQRLTRVDGPAPPPNGGDGEIADVDLVTAQLSDDLWKAATRASRVGKATVDHQFNPGAILDLPGFRTGSGSWVPISKETLWQARRRAVVDFERHGKEASLFTSHKVVAAAVAQLAGSKLTSDLLDPFCGAGSFLWEAIDYARSNGTSLQTVIGYEINERTADVARSIATVAPVRTEIIAADALRADLPLSNCVVSAPPFGLKLEEPGLLLDGSSSRDIDVVALDRIVRLLADDGRAILHLPVSITFRANAERYRHLMATEFRVAGLLGLPSGAVPGTGIRSVLMVIEKARPTATFIAQLGDDWETQLQPGGAAIESAQTHIDGRRP